MAVLQHCITTRQDGQSVSAVLRELDLSTGLIRRLKQNDGILLDEKPVTVRQRVTAGQVLTLRLPQTDSHVLPVDIPLDIVYEDDWVLVVNKPSGMPIHPSAGHYSDTLANGVAYYFQETGFSFHPITRLDRYTSGLVLIAKNSLSAAQLCQQAKDGTVEKVYLAVTDGVPQPLCGMVDLPIGRVEGSVIARQVRSDGKPAVTHYETVAMQDGQAIVKAKPITGRTHQIRVHMAAIGCPLAHDFLYGKEQEGKTFCLVCCELQFVHPHTKKRISIKNPSKLPNFD